MLPPTLLVPIGNSQALALRIVELLEADPKSRRRLGEQNRDKVVKHFGVLEMARALDAVFIEAASDF